MAAVDHRQAVSSTLEIPGGFLRVCVLAWRRRQPPFPCRTSREGPLGAADVEADVPHHADADHGPAGHGEHAHPAHGEAGLTRIAVSATLHCLTGCAIGEVAGLA